MSATREPEVPVCPCSDPATTHTMAVHMVKAKPRTGPLTFARVETPPEPTPTAEHIDAVARAIDEGHHPYGVATVECHDSVRRLLTSTDPAVHAAMLDALVRAGVLTEEQHCAHARAAQADGDYRSYTCEDAGTHCPPPRLVTPWEVAP